MEQFNIFHLTFQMNIFEKNHVFQKRFHVTLNLFLVQILDFQLKHRSRHCGDLKHQSNGTNWQILKQVFTCQDDVIWVFGLFQIMSHGNFFTIIKRYSWLFSTWWKQIHKNVMFYVSMYKYTTFKVFYMPNIKEKHS